MKINYGQVASALVLGGALVGLAFKFSPEKHKTLLMVTGGLVGIGAGWYFGGKLFTPSVKADDGKKISEAVK